MPRYRFSWDNLPPSLLRRLGSDLRLKPPVDQALRERYGARPEPNFVRDAWPTLMDAWLADDDEARGLVVAELQARSLGKARAPAHSANRSRCTRRSRRRRPRRTTRSWRRAGRRPAPTTPTCRRPA